MLFTEVSFTCYPATDLAASRPYAIAPSGLNNGDLFFPCAEQLNASHVLKIV